MEFGTKQNILLFTFASSRSALSFTRTKINPCYPTNPVNILNTRSPQWYFSNRYTIASN